MAIIEAKKYDEIKMEQILQNTRMLLKYLNITQGTQH